MTNHFDLNRLAAALRANSVTVDLLPGAQGRSARKFTNGYYAGCQASCVHHTGSSGTNPHNDIQYILQGKGTGYVISNAYTWRSEVPKVTLIASGPTYTEGTGGPLGIIPANRGNDFCFSNETAGGMGAAFPPGQQRAVEILHREVNKQAAELWNWPGDPFSRDRLFSHFEWAPGRKVDPKGASQWSTGYTMWDMDAFRRSVAAAQQPKGESIMYPLPVSRRLLDTRWWGQSNLLSADPNETHPIARPDYVPANATAMLLNFTTVSPQGDGYINAWAKDQAEPQDTSVTNFGRQVSVDGRLALVRCTGGGIVLRCVGAPVHLLIDVQGYTA